MSRETGLIPCGDNNRVCCTFERNPKMAILRTLIAIPLCIVLTGIDVLFFLTFFRLIGYRWHPRWLVSLNSRVKPAVDWYSRHVGKVLWYFSKRIFPERITLFIGMLVLTFIRFTLAALFSA